MTISSHYKRLLNMSQTIAKTKSFGYTPLDSSTPIKNLNISHKIELLKQSRRMRLQTKTRTDYQWDQINHLEVIIKILEMKKKGI